SPPPRACRRGTPRAPPAACPPAAARSAPADPHRSARRRRPAARAASSSAPVAAVDVDIAMRKIASINSGFALAETEADADLQLLLLHVGACCGFVVGCRALTGLG